MKERLVVLLHLPYVDAIKKKKSLPIGLQIPEENGL
jgi:hypothetical protein